jgi:hypothetical protein
MGLIEFLKSKTLTRENILRHKFLYDVSLAAAKRENPLGIYRTEVDIEGFDVMLDDRDNTKAIQLKSIIKGVTTSTWYIHRNVLRASAFIADKLHYEPSSTGVGIGGGVVIQEFVPEEEKVRYYYTDIIILELISRGIFTRKDRKHASKVIAELTSQGKSHEKIKITKGLFVRAKSPDCLLSLCGLRNAICESDLVNQLIRLIDHKDKTPKDIARKLIIDDIRILCEDAIYEDKKTKSQAAKGNS